MIFKWNMWKRPKHCNFLVRGMEKIQYWHGRSTSLLDSILSASSRISWLMNDHTHDFTIETSLSSWYFADIGENLFHRFLNSFISIEHMWSITMRTITNEKWQIYLHSIFISVKYVDLIINYPRFVNILKFHDFSIQLEDVDASHKVL